MADDVEGLVSRAVSLPVLDDGRLRRLAFVLRKPESDLIRAFVHAGLDRLDDTPARDGEIYDNAQMRSRFEEQVRSMLIDRFGTDGSSDIEQRGISQDLDRLERAFQDDTYD